jgi:hypothetical protein
VRHATPATMFHPPPSQAEFIGMTQHERNFFETTQSSPTVSQI